MSNSEKIKFSTLQLSVSNARPQRLKAYFELLTDVENRIYNNPDIVKAEMSFVTDDNVEYSADVGNFLLSLILWMPNVYFGVPVLSEDVYDLSEVNDAVYVHAFDRIIKKFINDGYDLDSENIIGTMKDRISKITKFYGTVVANSFSIHDLLLFMSRSPGFAELIHTSLDTNKMSMKEMEEFLALAQKEVKRLIIEDGRSSLYPFVASGIIKDISLGQMFVAVGPRSDIDTTILPCVVEGNWITGLTKMTEFFAISVTSRIGHFAKTNAVPRSGRLSRQTNFACLGVKSNEEVVNCGTKHYLSFYVATEKHLEFLDGKYRKLNEFELEAIDCELDKHLIGTTVEVRSHTKCITAHSHISTPCSICLGESHKYLGSNRIGGFVSIMFVNRLSQLGLSMKHTTQTSSDEVDDPLLLKYFNVSQSEVTKKLNNITGKSRDIKLAIPSHVVMDIRNVSIYDDDGEELDSIKNCNFNISLDHLVIEDNGDLQVSTYIDNSHALIISDYLVKLINGGKFDLISRLHLEEDSIYPVLADVPGDEFILLDIDLFEEHEKLFDVRILTEEVSRFLNTTSNIIDGRLTDTYTRPEEPIRDLVEIIFGSGIGTKGLMIHVETLIMTLMRSVDSEIEKPNYDVPVDPVIRLIKLDRSIKRGAVLDGILYSYINQQLTEPITLEKRAVGIFDDFFRNYVFRENGEEFRITRPYLFKDNK